MAIGQVLQRPTGDLAELWRRFAVVLEHQAQDASRRRAQRKAQNQFQPPINDQDPIST